MFTFSGGIDHGERVIIFANTKRDVNMIGDVLWERLGACVDTISGDRWEYMYTCTNTQTQAGMHIHGRTRARAHTHIHRCTHIYARYAGGRGQRERERTISAFRDGSVTVVVATDVAARGLDVHGIARVINYDFPGPDDYIHRIGRTGRAGATGVANTLFTKVRLHCIPQGAYTASTHSPCTHRAMPSMRASWCAS